jgi:putative spermidine/putrescine transport system permease protein
LGIQLPRLVRDDWGAGVILASAWKNIPFVALIVSGAMAAIPQDLFRAARTLGATRWVVFLRIQLPLSLPGITAALLLVFITSLGSYAIPNLLGPSYPLPLSLHMYDAGFREANWPLAYAMGTLLSIAAIAVLLIYYRLTRKAQDSLAAAGGE